MKVEAKIILTMPNGENIELSLEDARKLRDDLDQALPPRLTWYSPVRYYEYPTPNPYVYTTITCTTGSVAG